MNYTSVLDNSRLCKIALRMALSVAEPVERRQGYTDRAIQELRPEGTALDFLPDQIERGFGFTVAGCMDDVHFFLAC